MTDLLNQLIVMSNHLGDPANDYVILGEGNTSTKIDDKSFWVKASGTQLRTIGAQGFVQVYFEPVLALLAEPNLSDEQVKQALTAAKVDPSAPGHPSVETAMHAAILSLPGINFVGHTHPSAINMLTCSVAFETAVNGRIFPDEIVLGGPAPVIVPYVDPGLPLARGVKQGIDLYLDKYGELPKVILLQNHGFVALAGTAQQVENITAMGVKAARILIGTYALGGPHFLSAATIDRIHTRPDEHYRQRILGQR